MRPSRGLRGNRAINVMKALVDGRGRAAKLAGGHWTHDYALTAQEARALGLPVKVGMPPEVMQLMSLYPQPIQRSGVEYLPIEMPRQRRV
jgi:hypothetical protein